MSKTSIEWTEETWNPVSGCTKISPGCKNCYAERMARRLAGRAGYPEIPRHFDVTLHPDKLDTPLRRKKPTAYFIPSMGDLCHPDVPLEFIWEVWKVMRDCPQHTFQVLTKRPRRMANDIFFFYRDGQEPLPNVWGGVSVENQNYLWRAEELLYFYYLAIRFVSLAPLLGPIAFSTHLLTSLDWVIVEGESGPGARPMHPDWVGEIRDQCIAAGAPFFFKQWGAWLHQSQTTAQQRDEMHHKLKRYSSHKWPDGSYSWRVGKKYAGRLLDGREWNEMPQ